MPAGDLPLPGPRLEYVGHYIWDNSVLEYGGTFYRYALIAPRTLKPNDRHENARLVLATSADGVTWVEEPKFNVQPNTGTGEWPNHVIWTSNAVVKRSGESREFLLFITGRSGEDGRLQKIGLCRSPDGICFDRPRVILDPTTLPLTEFGYDATDSDGVYPAWRDPYPFQDPETGSWHLFFAAKPLHPRPAGPVGTVGHAVAADKGDTFEHWQLRPPLDLPQYYHQLEVPSVIYRGGRYYLFVSTQNNPDATDEDEKEAAFRAYTCKELDGRWKKVRGLTDFLVGPEVYATTVFPRENARGDFAAVAFHSEGKPHALSGTAVAPVTWDAASTDCPWPAPRLTFAGKG